MRRKVNLINEAELSEEARDAWLIKCIEDGHLSMGELTADEQRKWLQHVERLNKQSK